MLTHCLRDFARNRTGGAESPRSLHGLSQAGRYVALKVLPDESASDADALGRFQREAKT